MFDSGELSIYFSFADFQEGIQFQEGKLKILFEENFLPSQKTFHSDHQSEGQDMPIAIWWPIPQLKDRADTDNN